MQSFKNRSSNRN